MHGEAQISHTVHAFWQGSKLPKQLSIVPNPSNGHNLKATYTGFSSGAALATITDAAGRRIWTGTFALAGSGELDLASEASYKAGVYILTVADSDEVIHTRFVVQ